MLETLAFFFFDAKKGKRRSNMAIVGFTALLLYAFGGFLWMFWELSGMLCQSLVSSGLDWMYFSYMGMMAFAFGMMMSIFTMKGRLYEAKDNEMLLAMPLPTWMILITRLIGIYCYVLLFQTLVFVPALVRYALVVGGVLPIVSGVIVLLFMPLGTMAISGLLGWLIALVCAKFPLKNFFTLLFAVGFMIGYSFLYSKANDYISYLLANGAQISGKIQTMFYPFWKMGAGACGDVNAITMYALIFVGAFALIYLLIAKTFLSFVTMKRVFSRASYKERRQKTQKISLALLRKEFLRLIKNPMIALNTMLGSVMFIVFAVYVFSQKSFLEMIEMLGMAGAGGMPIELLFMGVFCMIATMNMSAASSISLEGENLWLLRTLPIATENILCIKAFCQFIATLVPAFVSILAVGIYVKLPIWCILLTILVLAAFSAAISLFGVAVNLKFPNLHWTNEIAVVKQSLSTFLGLFGGFGIFALLVGGYFLFGKYMLAWGYGLLCLILLILISAGIWLWICRKGVKVFENL